MKISPVTNNYKAQSENRQSFGHIRYKKKYLTAVQKGLAEKVLNSKHIRIFRDSYDLHLSIEEVPFSKKNIFYKAWRGSLENVSGYVNEEKWFKCTASTTQRTIDANLLAGASYAEKHSAKHVDDTAIGKVCNAFGAVIDKLDDLF